MPLVPCIRTPLTLQVSADPNSELLLRAESWNTHLTGGWFEVNLTAIIHTLRFHVPDEVLYIARIVEAMGRESDEPKVCDPPGSTITVIYVPGRMIEVSCGFDWGFKYLEEEGKSLIDHIYPRRYFKYQSLKMPIDETYRVLQRVDVCPCVIRVKGQVSTEMLVEAEDRAWTIHVTISGEKTIIEIDRHV